MFPAVVLAVSVGASTAFLDSFKGKWRCTNSAGASSALNISSPDGTYWAVVSWGNNRDNGTAYVGYLRQNQTFFYNDFHNDGTYAQLKSPLPVENRWRWTGSYYPKSGPIQTGLDVTWTLTPKGTLVRKYGQHKNGTFIDRGSDTCYKSP